MGKMFIKIVCSCSATLIFYDYDGHFLIPRVQKRVFLISIVSVFLISYFNRQAEKAQQLCSRFDCQYASSALFGTRWCQITTPNKDQHGVSKTVFSHISKLHGLLNDWTKMRDKGVRLCRTISTLKLHECDHDYNPSQLKPLMDSLLDTLDGLKNIIDGVHILNKQLQALAKLQPTDDPVISTWPVSKISQTVLDIYESLQKEYRLKQIITENVAHSRDEKLIEVYISAWEFEAYFSIESNAYLFAEVGITGVT